MDPGLDGPRVLAARGRTGEREQATGHVLQVGPRTQIHAGPLVWGHLLRRRRERRVLVQVVGLGVERNLVGGVVRENRGVGVLVGRHLLEDLLDLLVFGLAHLAAAVLGGEAVGRRHDRRVEIGPARHENGVDLLAHALVETVDGLAVVQVEREHLGVHVREGGALLAVGEPQNLHARREQVDAQVDGLQELAVVDDLLDLERLGLGLGGLLLGDPGGVGVVDEQLLEEHVHLVVARDHHDLGREARLRILDELGGAVLLLPFSDLAIDGERLVVVGDPLDHLPHLGK
mmetsp:Transcript_24372/g.76474  ORF Transcript_24372/g.76474 Transcript_24372/m.76474 type:complete len:288 (-) Transcript_24372:1575-2438(-)